MGLNLAVEQIEFFTIGKGRPANRIHQQGFRWVANDARRAADGTNITYLVDQSDGATASGLTSIQTEAAIDRALTTWDDALPGIDVETVALHENGHSLELGHFGPPPAAVMNPVYAGIQQDPLPIDHAGMCAVWASWPK